jgi:magnesium chelatase family protein
MSFAKVYSAQHALLKAAIITVEVDLSQGLHAFSIVGLPDKGVEESRDRVSAAIKNSGYTSPKSKNQKVIVSLAPADIRKEGPIFDLSIALAYLIASEDIAFEPKEKIFLGELALDGTLRKIQGVLPQVIEAKRKGFKEIFLPQENAEEAALITGIAIFGASSLKEVIRHINTKEELPIKLMPVPQTKIILAKKVYEIDMSDIKGQEGAKRGLEIAAAGGHNIALYGPPGTGKTMLAKAFAYLLPNLTFQEILETTSIHSIAGTLRQSLMTTPPFRAPHHTASHTAMVGGGSTPKPGEVTLAHRGILFMDEFPEFDRKLIEALRQPLEERFISISRVRGSAHFPAHFILIATMNPCPCGNQGLKNKECKCSNAQLANYSRKISGPIIDRIDLWIEAPLIEYRKLTEDSYKGEETESIRKRILKARIIQKERFKKAGGKIKLNSEMSAKEIMAWSGLSGKAKELLTSSAEKLELSARSYHRIIKVARTIADLDHKTAIETPHILEALQYRPKKKDT